MMDNWKEFFHFSKTEQYAIFVLMALIVSVSLFIFIHPRYVTQKHYNLILSDSTFQISKLETKQKGYKQDSTIDARENFNLLTPDLGVAQSKITPFKFNPNQLPEEEWKKLGLTDQQIRTIKNFESKGGRFYKKEDLAKIYSISKDEYAILEPFIVIPVADSSSSVEQDANKQRFIEKVPLSNPASEHSVNLNNADSASLLTIPGLGPWTVHRILKYRIGLGGYHSISQLLEVSGIDSTRFVQIKSYLTIEGTSVLPLKINRLSFKELLKHPYIEYDHTKNIMNYRESKGFINDVKALKSIAGFKDEELQKLLPYLDFN